jgi:hypothetical protein
MMVTVGCGGGCDGWEESIVAIEGDGDALVVIWAVVLGPSFVGRKRKWTWCNRKNSNQVWSNDSNFFVRH